MARAQQKNHSAIETFTEYLGSRGFLKTPQRRAVLEEILGETEHFDVEELAARMRNRPDPVSRATVYRTVSHLQDSGLIRKVDFDETHAHYECTAGTRHHEHLICQRCGRVVEFEDKQLERRIESVANNHHFAMARHTVQIFGCCEECHEQA